MDTAFIRENIIDIWVVGGHLMVPLALLGLLMYFNLFRIYAALRRKGLLESDPNQWQHWVERPEDAKGLLGEVIRYVQTGPLTPLEIRRRLATVRGAHIPELRQRIDYAAVLVSTAPLAGLLGTVVGMLATFRGLAQGTGATSVGLVAEGISEALITTQTGLVLAIPGYVILERLRRKLRKVEIALNQIEILTLQRCVPQSA